MFYLHEGWSLLKCPVILAEFPILRIFRNVYTKKATFYMIFHDKVKLLLPAKVPWKEFASHISLCEETYPHWIFLSPKYSIPSLMLVPFGDCTYIEFQGVISSVAPYR